MKNAELAGETRGRLLEAAGEVFAERGFHSATIREICDRAGANVAAINYHFGDKETLYAEVFHEWSRLAEQKYPPTMGLGEHPTTEERLRAFVLSFLHRITDSGRPVWHGKLIAREISEPTGMLNRLIDKIHRPLNDLLESIVRELLGDKATTDRVRLYSASVMGQCLHYHFARPVIERIYPEQGFQPRDIEQLATHIARFSLAAIHAATRPCKEAVKA